METLVLHGIPGFCRQAPALHGGLSLSDRCENALSGRICLDLWHLVAGRRAEQMKVPRHKLVLASQTRSNLQGVATCVVSICASKDENWDAWREPHGLSEVKIEHRFGELRSQFAGGEMSARAYWRASARLSRQLGKASEKRQKDCLGYWGSRLFFVWKHLGNACSIIW